MNDAMHELLHKAMSVAWESLPGSTRLRARQALVDTLATTVAGSTAGGMPELRDQLLLWGGRPEATVVHWQDELPAPAAATLNSSMGRAVDYDDCDDETGDHPSVATVPAALAAAQWAGVDRMSEVLAGIVAGTEVVLRIRRATDRRLSPELPWTTGTYAPLGAAVAAARTMGVDFDVALDAVGIAFTEMSNTCQSQSEGALAHRIHQGAAVGAGVASVAYALRGVRGVRGVLEGTFGVFNAYLRGDADRGRLMASAPRDGWWLDQVSLKPYPSCRFTHGPIQAALQLRDEGRLAPDDIASARVAVNECGVRLCGGTWGPGRSPASGQFNIRYTVAAAFLRGSVTLADFSPERVADADVQELAERIDVVHDESFDANHSQVGPARLSVVDRAGGTSEVMVDQPYGHPVNAISLDDHVAKVADCLRTGDPQMPEIPKVVERLGCFLDGEEVGTVDDVVGPFLGARPVLAAGQPAGA